MPNNTGLLLLGLGALLFLGRGGTPQKRDQDNRVVTGNGGAPMGSAFDIQSYIDGLFGYTAKVPVQPPMQFFYPPNVVVTSSGVPAVVETSAELVTPTTKVQIGGDGGRTIVASSLAIIRQEQIAKQEFAHAANADRRTAPEGEQFFYADTVEANRIEEARMRKYAADLIAKNIEKQRVAAQRTREAQEAVIPVVAAMPPTINFDFNDDDWSMNPFSSPGQSITVSADTEFLDVDFTRDYSDTFVISGGMDSPTVYASEDEQPSGVAVHEITAQYDIGF